jgi:phthiocerol/phenolphthiocerol synthesis type-I polyketide synthase E
MSDTADAIAVIGISGRFPQAADVAEFWERLREGRECIARFSEQDLLDAGVPSELLQHPAYVRANGMVDDIEMFDASFFGFNPRDAEVLDPQQRMFLECAWEALEDSGRVPDRHAAPVGMFAGASMSTYAFQLYNNPALAGLVNDFQILISNDKDHLATRAAYKLNLKGPVVSLGTACSTSLVATCLAAQSLLDYQCDMALAGGVSLGVPMQRGYLYEPGGISSPDGHCRPFDASAMGTVGGNGCAVVVLKRLSDAMADGDPIRAVIRGWGLNNDGSGKVGYTAPSVEGQASAIAMALAMADVHPDTITMMEAHGTATPLGDPIEFTALSQAWRRATGRQYCALGSLKSNMGHMDAAAGAAGLVKCVLSLQQRQIPPSLHFVAPNPKLDLAASPFFVNTELRDWQPACGVRRAAVSSFGIGGTNAHVILEEAPAVPPTAATGTTQLLPLSARSAAALDRMSQRLAEHLEQRPALDLAEVAHTLQVGRSEFRFRRVLLAAPHVAGDDLSRWLSAKDPRHVISGVRDEEVEGVAFLLPGQGAQHAGMSRGLYRDERVFRETVDRCSEILQPLLGLDLRGLLFEDDTGETLRQTELTQPAVFTISYALGRLWMHWGIKPVALLGHSVGEYSAACLAGVFSLEDALWLIAERGRILASMPRGSMLAVALPEAVLRERFAGLVDIAAVNGPASCVLAGPPGPLAEIRALLESEGEAVQPLQTSHAFHSRLMDGAAAPMEKALRRVRLLPPNIPCISNVTGRWLQADEARSPGYWSQHVRATVRFSDGLAQLMRETRAQLLEVGPGTTLSTLARQHGARTSGRPVLSSCRHPLDAADDHHQLLQTLGRLWIAGARVDWGAVQGAVTRRRVALPTYPFERQRFWIDTPAPELADLAPPLDEGARLPLEHWSYLPRWVRLASLPMPSPEATESWVVFGGTPAQSDAVADALADLGQRTTVLRQLAEIDTLEAGSLVFICLDGVQPDALGRAGFDRGLTLLQHLSRRAEPSRVLLLTRRIFAVTPSDPAPDAEAAGVLGPALVAPQEYPQLHCQVVDLDPVALQLLETGHVQALIAEALAGEGSPWMAHRGGQRWSLSFEPAPLAPLPPALAPVLEGCYIITGGLGRIGLLIAEFLARRGARAVILSGRTALADGDARVDRLRAIEALGTRVVLCNADIAVPAQTARVVAAAREAGGRVDGVFHAAGLTGPQHFTDFGAIDSASAQAHFAAKHRGAQALAAALTDDPPAFFCLMSSISTVLGGVGFAAYAAANAMLDATAASARGPTRWVTIDWDGWGFDAEPGDDTLIHAENGIDLLERILAATDLRHVVVSVRALGPRLQTWVQRPAAAIAGTSPEPLVSAGHERPELSTDFVVPPEGRSTLIADIWRELLGLAQVGANDNFFELGGHSLLAIQVVSRLRQALSRDIPVRMMFDHPTVAALHAALDAAPVEGMAELLDRIEAMPDEEVSAMLQDEESR